MNTKAPKESLRIIETVDKALSVLDCFTHQNPELTLKEISENTNLHKSGVLRLCGTLCAKGYLTRDPEAVRYKLGSKLLTLGKIYEQTNSLIKLARPIMRELTNSTGETSLLFIINNTKRLCLAMDEAPQPIRYSFQEGRSVELVGAGGKVLMAYSSATFREEVKVKRALGKFQPVNNEQWDRMEEEYAVIRQQGYAVSMGEMIPEAAALAAPVFSHDNKILATLVIGGPLHRFTIYRQPDILAKLKIAANQLSIHLGYNQQMHRES